MRSQRDSNPLGFPKIKTAGLVIRGANSFLIEVIPGDAFLFYVPLKICRGALSAFFFKGLKYMVFVRAYNL